jgi:hypothetical protein
MSKTILAKVDGWTPLIDGLTKEQGVIAAAVFGKVWRYCQMPDGVCRASQERIAAELGISRVTVNSHIEKLCSAGYLIDNTPALIGLPHQYSDTGKAGLSISFTAHHEPPVKEIDTTCKEDLHLPVKEIDTKIVLKKEKETKVLDPITHSLSFAKDVQHSVLCTEIESAIKVQFGMEATSTKNGMKFVDHAAKKTEAGEHYQTFLDYWKSNGGDRKYWSFNRMIEMWPTAFSTIENTSGRVQNGLAYL